MDGWAKHQSLTQISKQNIPASDFLSNKFTSTLSAFSLKCFANKNDVCGTRIN